MCKLKFYDQMFDKTRSRKIGRKYRIVEREKMLMDNVIEPVFDESFNLLTHFLRFSLFSLRSSN